MKKPLLLVALSIATASVSWAQGQTLDGSFDADAFIFAQVAPPQAPPEPPGMPCPPDQPCPMNPEMEKERRMLEAIRVTRMTEALRLTDEQVAKFLPRLQQIEERQRSLRQERARIIRQLAEMLEKSERLKDLKPKLDELEKLEQEQMQKNRQMMKDLDTLLSVEQRARWRVFNERFDQEIRDMAKEIRKKRIEHHRMRQW